jgi:hypothetical protein
VLTERLAGLSGEATALFGSLQLAAPRFDAPLRTFDDARVVFLYGMERLRKAKEYYVLDGYVSDHISLLSDEANLYRFLIPYETDTERKMCAAVWGGGRYLLPDRSD